MVTDAPVVVALLDYCAAVDRRDAAGVADLFCSDARLQLVSGRAVGSEAILAAFRSAFADGDATTAHFITRPDVTFDGDDEASVRARLTVWREAPAAPAQVGRGRYETRFRFEHGRWMIAEMLVVLDGPLLTVSSKSGSSESGSSESGSAPDQEEVE